MLASDGHATKRCRQHIRSPIGTVVLPITGECNQDHRTGIGTWATFRQMTFARFVGFMKTSDHGCNSPSTIQELRIARCVSKGSALSRSSQAAFCVFLLTGFLFASNHPAITGRNANCALCHSDLTQGQSVHSQGELGCDLCHSSRGGEETVEMFLTAPKEQICFLCHERTSMQQHVSSSTNKECLVCHDAHKSARAMLLRRNIEDDYVQSTTPKVEARHRRTVSKTKSHALTGQQPGHPQVTDHKM